MGVASRAWDLTGAGTFTSASTTTITTSNGVSTGQVTLTWGQLRALKIDQGTYSDVRVEAVYAGNTKVPSAATTLVIDPTAPTATFAGTNAVLGGSSTVSFTSPFDHSLAQTTAGFTYSYDFSDNGTFNIANSTSATAAVPAALLAQPGSFIVHGRITAEDGTYTDYYTTITVSDAAPTVTVGSNQTINAGVPFALSGITFSDPGYATPTSGWGFTASINWGDGTTSPGIVTVAQGSAGVLTTGTVAGSHQYLPDKTYTVTVTVTDAEGEQGSGSFKVTVDPPVVTVVPGPTETVGAGTTFTPSQAGFTDTGAPDTATATINWGDGSATQTIPAADLQGPVSPDDAGTTDVGHIYGYPGTYKVTLSVTDSYGSTNSGSFQVDVMDVAPTVDAGPNVNQSPGVPVSVGATFSDPGFPAGGSTETYTASINWGDGTSSNPDITTGTVTVTQGSAGVPTTGTVSGSHTYSVHGTFPVTVTVLDSLGGQDSATLMAVDVPPTVAAGPSQTVKQGSPVDVNATFSDPGFEAGATAANDTATIDWGDGTITTGTVTLTQQRAGLPTTGTIAGSHIYADQGDYTVTVTITDGGGVGQGQLTATVNDVGPTLAPLANGTYVANQPFTTTETFTEPGIADQDTVTVNWGDGTSNTIDSDSTYLNAQGVAVPDLVEPTATNPGSITLGHTYGFNVQLVSWGGYQYNVQLASWGGYSVQVVSWGDGSNLPTGTNLVLLGLDNSGLLHIRIFDASGDEIVDTDETQLPATDAQAIATLKQQLLGLAPGQSLAGAQEAQTVSEATALVGLTPWVGSTAPTSGTNLVVVGTDNYGLLHIRIFNAGGQMVLDTDETQLPSGDAQAIATLEQQLPGLMAQTGLTAAQENQIIDEVKSITGLSLLYDNNASYTVTLTITDKDGESATVSALYSPLTTTAVTTTTVTSSTPGDASDSGQPVTFTATVTPPAGDPAPSGTVTFDVNGVQAAQVPLSAGVAQYMPSPALTPGSYTITAFYSGATADLPSDNTAAPLVQTVSQDATTTTVASTAPGSVVYGQSVTFTATVAVQSPGAGTPGGKVTFYDGNTPLGPAVPVSKTAGATTATATYIWTAQPVNTTHTISAVYSGDTDDQESPSNTIDESVGPDGTITTPTTTAASISFGQSLTLTATVSPEGLGSGSLTGSVDFYDVTTASDLGSVLLGTGGVASLTTATLPVGPQTITETFTSGNSNFTGSATSQTETILVAIYTLYSLSINLTPTGSLYLSGGADIDIPGRLVVDSPAKPAVTLAGTSSITASSVQVAGTISNSGGNPISPAPTTLSAPVADPLAGLGTPNLSGKATSVNWTSGSHSLSQGIYSTITLSGAGTSLSLSPGVYVIAGGGLSVTNGASISGSGVMIYDANSSYPAAGGTYGGITLNTTGTVNLSAAATGTYAGLLFFQSRTNPSLMTIGGSAPSLSGTIYASDALLSMSGGAQVADALVVNRLQMSGTALVSGPAGPLSMTGEMSRAPAGLSSAAIALGTAGSPSTPSPSPAPSGSLTPIVLASPAASSSPTVLMSLADGGDQDDPSDPLDSELLDDIAIIVLDVGSQSKPNS